MLEIRHLCKSFGNFRAVDDLNLHISHGEVFGFVGHNGAGKTTTMKIAVGLLSATSGEVLIDGEDALTGRGDVKRKIGYMPDFFGVYDNLKALEYMEFYASLYGIVGKQARDTSLGLLDLVNLSDKADACVDHLSRGMKQRLCLARSLVHNPGLLMLDEPASGLDPRARFEMKEILRNLGGMGKTVVVSSHILPELADMCDTIGIMQHGRLLMYGTVDDIQMKAMHARPLHVRVLDRQEEAVNLLREDPDVKRVSVLEDYVVADYVGDDEKSVQLLKRLIAMGIPVESFYKEKGNLESLFLEITDEAVAQEQISLQNPSGGDAGEMSGWHTGKDAEQSCVEKQNYMDTVDDIQAGGEQR
ncbi:MAG: ABC transporter ATP-binding protein [Lachnospiraceae bacterium]|nr:ABC transporter ATP-binding protein [Lachnospiraceae bacterium]